MLKITEWLRRPLLCKFDYHIFGIVINKSDKHYEDPYGMKSYRIGKRLCQRNNCDEFQNMKSENYDYKYPHGENWVEAGEEDIKIFNFLPSRMKTVYIFRGGGFISSRDLFRLGSLRHSGGPLCHTFVGGIYGESGLLVYIEESASVHFEIFCLLNNLNIQTKCRI